MEPASVMEPLSVTETKHDPQSEERSRSDAASTGTLTRLPALAASPQAGEILDLLLSLSRDLASSLDEEQLLARIASGVRQIIDFQSFSVLLWNEAEQRLETYFSWREKGCLSYKPVIALGEGLTGTAAKARRPVRVADVRKDARTVFCGEDRLRSELVVPLLLEGRLIGVLDLESYHVDAFSEEQEKMLEVLSSSIAVSLENGRLYERARRGEETLSRDLATARKIQRSLLPKSSPWIAGVELAAAYAPARELAGDLYDFLPYRGGKTALVLGDVAGKGTGAALYGSLVTGLMRGLLEEGCGPSRTLSTLNLELLQLKESRHFVALMLAILDPEDRTLTVASSGLPYPWLLRAGQAQEIAVGGLPLGRMSGIEYEQVKLQLEPGDVLLLATDGLEECQDAAGRLFGSDGVARVLTALGDGTSRSIAQGLLGATDRHLGAVGEPQDDRTLIALRVR